MLEKKLTLTKTYGPRTKTKWIPYWFELNDLNETTKTITYYNRQEDYRAKQPIGAFKVHRVANNPDDDSLTIHYQESASDPVIRYTKKEKKKREHADPSIIASANDAADESSESEWDYPNTYKSDPGQFTIRNVPDATSADGPTLFKTLTGMVDQ